MSLRLRRIVIPFVLATLVVACKTIDPVPQYIPPYDSLSSLGLSAAAFSPNGRLAAVANFNTIWILEPASMRIIVSFPGHDRFGTNNTLVFLDENRIASTAKSGGVSHFFAAVKIWDLNNPYPVPVVIEIPELDRYAISLAHSQSSGALAVGGENGVVVLLEPDGNGSYQKKSLPGLSGPVLSLSFSNDGSMLAAGGVHPSIPIWDLQTSLEVGSLPTEDDVYDLDLVPGKQSLLVSGTDLRLWEFFADDEPEKIRNPSSAGDYIAIGAYTATYAVLAVATVALGGNASVPYWPNDDSSEPDYGFCQRAAEISPDRSYIVDIHAGKLKEKIRILNLRENKVVRRLNPRGGDSCSAAFSPDGRKLLIVNNRVARLYDTDTWDFEDFLID